MQDDLIEEVMAILERCSDEEKRVVISTTLSGMRKPFDYEFAELDSRFKAAREQEASAPSEEERRRLGRHRFDLDSERRRRQTSHWLGNSPPPPRDFPEGLGSDAAYPQSLGGTLFSERPV